MPHVKEDPERENRIAMEIVVDCYNEDERMMGWYYHLQDAMKFPFSAECIEKRKGNPLFRGEIVKVLEMATEEDCLGGMMVMAERKGETWAVPLAQLAPRTRHKETVQAVEDWHYWIRHGYQF